MSANDLLWFNTDTNRRIRIGKMGCEASGRQPYSDEENSYIIDNFSKITQAQMALDIGRPAWSVNARVKKLKALDLLPASSPWRVRPYTEAEDQFIIENRHLLNLHQVGSILGRSAESISYRANQKLGISYVKIGEESPVCKLTNEDIELIRQLADLGLPYPEIAEKFEINRSTVSGICNFYQRLYPSYEDFADSKKRQRSAIDINN